LWSAGTLAGPGAVTVSGSGTLSGALEADTSLVGTGPLTLGAGSSLGGTGTLRTTAALHASAATIALPFAAGGAVDVDAGVLKLTGGGSGAGPYAVADGAALDWALGTFALSAPAVTGATRISGADVTTTGDGGLGSLELTGGSLTVGATLAGPGALGLTRLTWSGGTLAGSGTATAGALSVSGAGVTLAGTLSLTGGSTLAAPLELDGRLENAGVLDVQDDADITGAGVLVNTGTVRKSAGTDVSLIGVPLDNDGVLDAETGTLRLTGGSGIGEVSTGSYAAAAGATIQWAAGAYALDSPVESGAGTALVSGAALSVTGPARFARLVLAGGGADFAGPLTADAVSLGAATLSGGETMALGQLFWTGGTLSTRTALGHAGTTTVGGLTSSGASKTLRNRTLDITGDSTVTGGPLVLADHAAVRNAALLALSGDAAVTGTGSLANTGTLRATDAPAIGVPVDNQGTIDVRGGTLALASLNDGTLGGGTYDLAGTLVVPGLDVTANAGTIRLAPSGGVSDGSGDALAHLAANTGTLDLGGRDLALAGGLANSGTVRLGGATLTTAGPYTQSGGLTGLDGGTLRAGAPVELGGGRLEGAGTVVPGLHNAATVAPGAPLAVTGDYVQAPAATLAAPPGRLAVTGTASLGGTLAFDPSLLTLSDGATFPLLTAAAVTGQWAPPPASAGYAFGVAYNATGATLTAHKIPDIPVCGNCQPPPCCAVRPAGEGATTSAVSGTVLVKTPGTGGFTPVVKGAPVPPGTVVDATKGTISLVAASSFTDPNAPPTQMTVAAAIFKLQQEKARDGHTAVTDLVVQTPHGLAHACAPRKGIMRSKIATIRRIRATVAKGVVRTLAAAAVLTTRNASFAMRDRCDGTSTRLVRGKGTVFDRVRGRRVRLSAAARRAYIARTRLFQIRQARLRKVPKP
jgi:hypothetical protein